MPCPYQGDNWRPAPVGCTPHRQEGGRARQRLELPRSSWCGLSQSGKVDAFPTSALKRQGPLSPCILPSNNDIPSPADWGGELHFPLAHPSSQISRAIESQPQLIYVFSLRPAGLK